MIALSACSSLQIAYNYAPNYLAYKLNVYLNLTESQKSTLDQELSKFVQWHTQLILPEYTQRLESWRDRVDSTKPYSASEVLEIQQQIEQALQVIGAQASAQLASIVVTLTLKQQDRLRMQFESDNKEYADEYLKNPESEATRKNNHKRSIKRFEDWLGALTRDQEKLLTDLSDKRTKVFVAWNDERKLRQQALLDTLEEQRGKDPQQAELALAVYLNSLSNYREPTLAEQKVQLRQDWAEVTAQILNSLTAGQKTYLKKQLTGYANDFASLTPKQFAQKF
ncbi:MAG: DUF6279 family lipoprotein [Alcaligenaceae bacterium]